MRTELRIPIMMNETTTYSGILAEASKPVAPNVNPGPDYADSKRLFQGIPGMERSPGGRLWATWYSGGQGESPLNYTMLATSGNDGGTWEAPVLVVDPPGHVRAPDPNVWLDPKGRLWLFWTQCHTLHDGQWGVWAITTDDPEAARPRWSEPRRLADGVMLNKPTVLSDGEWLFPISLLPTKPMMNEKRMLPVFLRKYLRDLMSEEDVRRVDERAGAYVFSSTDNGTTIAQKGRAVAPEGCSTHNEHMVAERDDGSLLMLLRTSYGIGKSVSTDRGATWSTVVESGIPHTPSRFFFRRLRSGDLLLVKHGPMKAEDEKGDPIKFSRNNLTAFVSRDGGETWEGGLLLEERGCTYPDGTQAPDGTIRVIYDHGRREEKMICMARFTEEDALAGKPVSGNVKLGALINQATGVITPDIDWANSKGKDAPDEPLIFTGI